MAIAVFITGHWFLSLFCQTFFLHRYAAHKMFTMSRFWERAFYLLTFVTQGSSFLIPRAYALLHRMHHAFSDTEKDPHSPQHNHHVFEMMHTTYRIYHGLVKGTLVVERDMVSQIPEWRFLDLLGSSWPMRIAWGLSYTAFYGAFATHTWMFLLLPMHFLMGPIHGAIVNWCGHKYGYANFDNDDHSRNTLCWDFLMLGELFQNNHHRLPNRLNFAVRWFEFDPVYGLIRMMGWFRIVRTRRSAV
jgi:stearoyl-CoA desaturase (delta-9 desaturase)